MSYRGMGTTFSTAPNTTTISVADQPYLGPDARSVPEARLVNRRLRVSLAHEVSNAGAAVDRVRARWGAAPPALEAALASLEASFNQLLHQDPTEVPALAAALSEQAQAIRAQAGRIQ